MLSIFSFCSDTLSCNQDTHTRIATLRIIIMLKCKTWEKSRVMSALEYEFSCSCWHLFHLQAAKTEIKVFVFPVDFFVIGKWIIFFCPCSWMVTVIRTACINYCLWLEYLCTWLPMHYHITLDITVKFFFFFFPLVRQLKSYSNLMRAWKMGVLAFQWVSKSYKNLEMGQENLTCLVS